MFWIFIITLFILCTSKKAKMILEENQIIILILGAVIFFILAVTSIIIGCHKNNEISNIKEHGVRTTAQVIQNEMKYSIIRGDATGDVVDVAIADRDDRPGRNNIYRGVLALILALGFHLELMNKKNE